MGVSADFANSEDPYPTQLQLSQKLQGLGGEGLCAVSRDTGGLSCQP